MTALGEAPSLLRPPTSLSLGTQTQPTTSCSSMPTCLCSSHYFCLASPYPALLAVQTQTPVMTQLKGHFPHEAVSP